MYLISIGIEFLLVLLWWRTLIVLLKWATNSPLWSIWFFIGARTDMLWRMWAKIVYNFKHEGRIGTKYTMIKSCLIIFVYYFHTAVMTVPLCLIKGFLWFFWKGIILRVYKGYKHAEVNLLPWTNLKCNTTNEKKKTVRVKDLQHMKVACVCCIKSNSGGFWHCFRPFQLAVSLKDQLASIWTAKYLNFFFLFQSKAAAKWKENKKTI